MIMVSETSADKISIITPFYNPGSFLRDCIESILPQRYTNWELLLINDFSTDESNTIAAEYASNDSRIRVFQNNEKGLISALRTAYGHSTGQFITRMDADDKMTPNRLLLMQQELKTVGKNCVCIGKVKYFSKNELGEGYRKYEAWLNDLTTQSSNFDEIYRECSIPSPNFLIHREDFDKIGGFENDDYPEDYDLAFRMYQHGLKICAVDEVTLLWRDHSQRSTRTEAHYQPLQFIPMKVRYFLKIDHDPNQQLVLWGAGKKGKLIAQELIKYQVDFKWVTDNEKKIGKDIYGVKLDSYTHIKPIVSQVILGISSPEEIKEVTSKVSTKSIYRFF